MQVVAQNEALRTPVHVVLSELFEGKVTLKESCALSILVNSVTLNATNQNNVRCSNFRAVSIKEVEVKMDSEADVEAVKLVAEGKNC